MPTTLERDICQEFVNNGLHGDAVVDALGLTEGNPGAQSVYLQALRAQPTRAAEAFMVLKKHNLFSWKIWLVFKNRFQEQIGPFLEAVLREDPETLAWAEEHTSAYAARRGISNEPLPYMYYEGPPESK